MNASAGSYQKNSAQVFRPVMAPDAFAALGFVCLPAVLSVAECDAIAAGIAAPGPGAGGTRGLLQLPWCKALAARLRQHDALGQLIPAGHAAVQCTYFEKSPWRNWLVPWHRDLSIAVARRVDAPGLKGWSHKEGMVFVQPPADLLARLVVVRLHLDACGPEDGPLRVIAGSHRLTAAGQVPAGLDVSRADEVVCLAEPGALLVMRPLLLHASSKATGQSPRRVLHFVFGPGPLPHGLQWHHGA